MNESYSTEKTLQLIMLFLGMIVVVMVCFVLQLLHSILIPFCIALFLVYILEPLQLFLIRFRLSTLPRVLILLLTSFVVLSSVGLLVYSSANSLVENFPAYELRLLNILQDMTHVLPIPSQDVQTFVDNIQWKDHLKPGTVAQYIGQGFGNFVGFLSNLFMVVLYMVYLLFERESFKKRVHKGFDSEQSNTILNIVDRINQQIVGYLGLKTGISLVTGVVISTVLLLFGVDFAIFWGVTGFLLNFIPAIGSIIATIPPVIIAFLQFDTFTTPIAVAMLLGLTQMIIGNIIEPKVMGEELGLSPLVVILALIFWGWLWGPVGMILSVPIISAIRIICDNIEMLRPISRFLADE